MTHQTNINPDAQTISSQFVEITSDEPVNNSGPSHSLRLHYLTAGTGPVLLLLHGWPTSSHLWRNVMPHLAKGNTVIALDLPGFGQSDKPTNIKYSFRFYNSVLNKFLAAIQAQEVGLVVHDLGGPIGLHWATENPSKVNHLTLLNTLVYPKPSWAVLAFVLALKTPGLRSWLTSSTGLAWAMRIGVENKQGLTQEVLRPYQSPFDTKLNRAALIASSLSLSPKGIAKAAKRLPQLHIPIRLIYGKNDRILPDIAKTMTRLKQELPHAELTCLDNCGHFLQEDKPEEVGTLIADFIATIKQKESNDDERQSF